MHFKDLRIGLRQLAADPSYTAVVVFGLALAAATTLLLLAYLEAALLGDRDVPAAQRVLRLESKVNTPGADKGWIDGGAMAFHDHWKESGAQVEASSRYFTREMSLRVGQRMAFERISFVDAGLVEVFGLKPLAGDLRATLEKPDAVALSAGTAKRLFGRAPALGKTLTLGGRSFTVGAIVADRGAGSALRTSVLVNILSPAMPEPFRLKEWASLRGTIFVRLTRGATLSSFNEQVNRYFEQTPFYREAFPIYGKIGEYRGTPLPELPLTGAETDSTRRLVAGLSLSCLVISLLAAINFLNLSVVRTIGRQREIGIRKALGASPARIALQFIGEAILVALLASGAGFLLAWLAAPMVGDWVGMPIADVLWSPARCGLALAIGLGLGVLAGTYPAWVALRVDCAQSLAGRGHTETLAGLWLRRSLSLLQFGTAIAMIGFTVTVLWQTRHAQGAHPGYDSAPLLIIDAPVDMRDERLLALREAISHLPDVDAAGLAWDVPGRFNRNTTADLQGQKGETVLQAFSYVGPDFFQSYGVRPIAGRVFDAKDDPQDYDDRIVINASSSRQLGFASPAAAAGQFVRMGGHSVEIIGVIPDIRQRSLRDAASGVVYSVESARMVSVMSVRSRDPAATRLAIQQLWPRYFPDDVLRIEPVQAHLARLYDGDLRLGKLIGAAGIIALALAGFGLYALSAYTVRRRTAEIVLRKLHGARRRDIAGLLARELGAALLAGALIGLPVAAWLGEQYLAEFVDRAPIGASALVVALVATALMALIAATRHTARAMALSPARALRV